jgi:GMP synthase-like glutamine amidotransferase
MRIGLLECDHVDDRFRDIAGDYRDMFTRLLEPHQLQVVPIDVCEGELPHKASAFDAYVCTGSRRSAFDDLPWIHDLPAFHTDVASAGAPFVGICFGHQLLAETFGGHVEKVEKGWGVGLHSYPIVHHEPWMDDVQAVSVPVSHQDQVVIQPPNTEILASSLFTPYAALAWRDRAAISFQFHPEFSPNYARALIDARRERLPQPDAAIGSLDRPNDNARVGGWIRRFLAG